MLQIEPPPTEREILSDEQLEALTKDLPGELAFWKWEYVDGQIIMSPPANPDTGNLNAKIIARGVVWGENYGYEPFDSYTGFRLPNGDVRSPDAALIRRERWVAAATKDARKRLVPDILVELRSGSDRRAPLVEKCEYWRSVGAGYVLFVDPYRPSVDAWGEPPPGGDELCARLVALIAHEM